MKWTKIVILCSMLACCLAGCAADTEGEEAHAVNVDEPEEQPADIVVCSGPFFIGFLCAEKCFAANGGYEYHFASGCEIAY
jgi:hypothetical protein